MMKYSPIIILILVGCGKKQESIHFDAKSDLIFINIVDQTASKKKLASYLENISYAVLETNEHSLLAEPAKAFHVKGKFYIVDRKRDVVKAFDNVGKYLFDVGRIGKGPGEFLNVSDVQLSSDKNKLLVLSNGSQAIYEYDLNGKFLSRETLAFFGSAFCLLPDNEMAFHINYNVSATSGPYNLLVTDSDCDIREKHFYFGEVDIPSFAFTGFLNSTQTSCLYANAFSDTVFQIENKKIIPKYIYDFGKNSTTLKDMTNHVPVAERSYLGNHVLETDEALFFDYVHNRKLRFGMYKNTTKELLTDESLEADYLSSIFFTPIGISGDNKLISCLYAGRILYHIKNSPDFLDEVRQNDSRLYNLIKDLDETANPILMTFDID